jgi:hypothetical protein
MKREIMSDHNEELASQNGRFGFKKGWRKVAKNQWDINIRKRLYILTQDPHAPESVKDQAHSFLSMIVDDRMPTKEYEAARKFVRENKILNKEEVKRLEQRDTAESHAVFMACQACDNLRDRGIKISSRQERANMTMQIASAIHVLSDLQIRLMGGNDDDKG